ncbi:SURF1 family protein [Siculibacillus lacustris]|uniref:SURF1-like protein n=1 Tax=Siculibacillus lacustris TaxID=1549641 RepID=A0A4Q9VIL8_9HYPH|nr:SURF1 family protein [Siculibacillus lacustris]TBW34969.1 SURF1 family protein [Siculibacillus lacustris]
MTSAVRALIAPAIATLVAAAILAGLGTWQVRRLAWKRDLIATVEARTRAPATPAPSLPEAAVIDPDALDWRHVRIEGRWLPGLQARVHAVVGEPHGRLGGLGVFVMAPLARDDGSIVWINRGFVPTALPPGLSVAAPPAGPVAIEGILRRPEPRGAMTPADDRPHDLWFVRDPAKFAADFGLDPARVAPFTIDADASSTPPGGLPQAGETRVTFANDHLGYAITWYGLALAALGVFGVFARGRLRGR